MIRILIIDDEPAAGNILRLLIEKHISTDKEIRYCNSPEEGLELLPIFRPSLVLLDIEMPNMNGFDFLSQSVHNQFDVIFTTAYDKYAIKAIRFSALDYLLKPIDIIELQNAINRHIVKKNSFPAKEQTELVGNLIQNLKTKNPNEFKLAVSIKEGVFLYSPNEIVCLEGLNNYTKFYLRDKKSVLVSKTLKEYEEILTEHQFLRVHKSFLVNRTHIIRIDNEAMLWLSNELSVPVSRRKKTELLQLLTQIPS